VSCCQRDSGLLSPAALRLRLLIRTLLHTGLSSWPTTPCMGLLLPGPRQATTVAGNCALAVWLPALWRLPPTTSATIRHPTRIGR